MRFNDILGQEKVKEQLIKLADSGRVPHAQLYYGPEGTGALPLALAFAQYLNCEQTFGGDSCGHCPSCIKASKLLHPDIHFTYPVINKKAGEKPVSTDFIVEWRTAVEANPYMNAHEWLVYLNEGILPGDESTAGSTSKQGNITVRECQEIIKKLKLKSFEGKYKILIIWMPEYLRETGNILLKLLEEPPDNTVIILAAEDTDQILNTIQSRTQLFKLYRIEADLIKQRLIEEFQAEESTAKQATQLANGSFNEARKLVANIENDNQKIFEHWIILCSRDAGIEIVDIINQISKLGKEQQKNLLQYALYAIRGQLVEGIGLESLAFLKSLDAESIERLTALFDSGIYAIERNANVKILFHDLSIQLKNIITKQEVEKPDFVQI